MVSCKSVLNECGKGVWCQKSVICVLEGINRWKSKVSPCLRWLKMAQIRTSTNVNTQQSLFEGREAAAGQVLHKAAPENDYIQFVPIAGEALCLVDMSSPSCYCCFSRPIYISQ